MPKPILDYRDDDSPLWPARCRGYLEGRQASDCLASVELARLRAEKEALLAENNDLRREWLHTVSHDVVFTAEVSGEHGIDLSKMPISEATLAALNIGIDRENYRLRAENERLRAALAPFAVVADYLPDDLPADTVALTTPDEFHPWDIRAKYVYGARAALKAEP